VVNQPRFDAKGLLATIGRCGVTTLCAPPTVWRLFIQEKLATFKVSLREVWRRGEPLNPEVIDQVARPGADHPRRLRPDRNHGIGGQFAGPEGQGGIDGPSVAGLHRPHHRYRWARDQRRRGELVLGDNRPAGLMQGYQGDDGKLSGADGELYRSGDVVFADEEGYLTFVGRSDDVFKSSDYRISPFELESILLSMDPSRKPRSCPARSDPACVPKAYVLLVAGAERSSETALSIFRHLHTRLARSSAFVVSNW